MSNITLNKPSALTMVQRSLAKRAAGQLTTIPQAQPQQSAPKVLLLDISSSMDEPTENRNERRIDALRKLVADIASSPAKTSTLSHMPLTDAKRIAFLNPKA